MRGKATEAQGAVEQVPARAGGWARRHGNKRSRSPQPIGGEQSHTAPRRSRLDLQCHGCAPCLRLLSEQADFPSPGAVRAGTRRAGQIVTAAVVRATAICCRLVCSSTRSSPPPPIIPADSPLCSRSGCLSGARAGGGLPADLIRISVASAGVRGARRATGGLLLSNNKQDDRGEGMAGQH